MDHLTLVTKVKRSFLEPAHNLKIDNLEKILPDNPMAGRYGNTNPGRPSPTARGGDLP